MHFVQIKTNIKNSARAEFFINPFLFFILIQFTSAILDDFLESQFAGNFLAVLEYPCRVSLNPRLLTGLRLAAA